MHIASVAIFEGPAPKYDAVVGTVAGKLPLVPRYRQVVRFVPFDLGRPVWVDDPHFNVEYHVRHTALPPPGGEDELRKLVGRVMAQQLEAAMLFAEGRREEAIVLARQAAVVEAGLPFEFGPPVPVKPVNEQVGEMLMDVRRPREAMEAFELSLKRTPRRTLSLLGLARAAMAAKDIATAQRAYGELRDIWKKADKTLPELKELGLVPPPSSH